MIERATYVSYVARREIEAGERSNLIIAVGDLALRYPNLLEPWTSHIYAPLSDPDIGNISCPSRWRGRQPPSPPD